MGTTYRSALSWNVETTAVELVPSVTEAFAFYHACFRHKSPRISLFPSHSQLDAMPGPSLPTNRSLENVVRGYFAVEN